ncbi:MAG TPA: hypothetical protein VJB06_01235 [archaeon]|nr:hypothetical protein [archaeon]
MPQEEFQGVTIEEISDAVGLDVPAVKKYITETLKDEVEKEKLDLRNGKYDPFIIDLILIELEVDFAGKQLEKNLEFIRRKKKGE